MWNLLRLLGSLRAGRLVRELTGCRKALEALVQLHATALGLPNPLAPAVAESLRRTQREPPTVEVADVPDPGTYVDIEERRQAYEQARGRRAAFDQDFLGVPAEERAADAAVAAGQAVGVTVHPEDFSVPPGDQLRAALESPTEPS